MLRLTGAALQGFIEPIIDNLSPRWPQESQAYLSSYLTGLYDECNALIGAHERHMDDLHQFRSSKGTSGPSLSQIFTSINKTLTRFYPGYLLKMSEVKAAAEGHSKHLFKDLKCGSSAELQRTTSSRKPASFLALLTQPIQHMANYMQFVQRLCCVTTCDHRDHQGLCAVRDEIVESCIMIDKGYAKAIKDAMQRDNNRAKSPR